MKTKLTKRPKCYMQTVPFARTAKRRQLLKPARAFQLTSSLNDVCRCELASNGGSLASQDDCHRQMWAKPRAPKDKAEWPLAQRWPRSTAFSDCCVMGLASAIDLCHSAPSSLQQPLITISSTIIILNLREFYFT